MTKNNGHVPPKPTPPQGPSPKVREDYIKKVKEIAKKPAPPPPPTKKSGG